MTSFPAPDDVDDCVAERTRLEAVLIGDEKPVAVEEGPLAAFVELGIEHPLRQRDRLNVKRTHICAENEFKTLHTPVTYRTRCVVLPY